MSQGKTPAALAPQRSSRAGWAEPSPSVCSAPTSGSDGMAGSLDHLLARLVRQAVAESLGLLAEQIAVFVRDEIRSALADCRPAPQTQAMWLSPKGAAALVGVSYDTVLAWIGEGRLAAHRAGRQLRIRRSDLDVVMEQPSTPEPRSCDVDLEADRILRGEPLLKTGS